MKFVVVSVLPERRVRVEALTNLYEAFKRRRAQGLFLPIGAAWLDEMSFEIMARVQLPVTLSFEDAQERGLFGALALVPVNVTGALPAIKHHLRLVGAEAAPLLLEWESFRRSN